MEKPLTTRESESGEGPEGVKEPITICRLCLQEEQLLLSIFGTDLTSRTIFVKLETILQIKVENSSNWPCMICIYCLAQMETLHKFITSTKANQEQLPKLFGDPIGEISPQEVKEKQLIDGFKENTLEFDEKELDEDFHLSLEEEQSIESNSDEELESIGERNEVVIMPPEEEEDVIDLNSSDESLKEQNTSVQTDEKSTLKNEEKTQIVKSAVILRKVKFSCKICNLHFSTPQKLDHHNLNHIMQKKENINNKFPIGKYRRKCPLCEKSYYHSLRLYTHMKDFHKKEDSYIQLWVQMGLQKQQMRDSD